MSIAVGSILEGVVTGITKFGAFVELPGGVTGLVHISEIADAYVKDINDYLKKADRVSVKVINVDAQGKIGLSIKQARPDYQPTEGKSKRSNRDLSFEDKLAKFLKESEERQIEARRNTESKRRGGRSYRY